MSSTTANDVAPEGIGFSRAPRRERRGGARVAVDRPVDVIADGFPHACRLMEASATGMVVELTQDLARREPPIVAAYDIAVSATRRVRVEARTVWRRGRIQAARFVALDEAQRVAIVDMLCETLAGPVTDVERLEIAEGEDHLPPLRHAV